MRIPFTNIEVFSTENRLKPEVEDLRTVSHSEADYRRYSNFDEDIDNALAAKGYSLYEKDMMADDQVKACILIKKYGVTVGGYTIQAARSESDEDYEIAKEIADFVSFTVSEMNGSINNILFNIANSITTGFSVQEVVWKLIDYGQYKGKIGVKSIKNKPVSTITFDMDEYGNVNWLIQTIDGIEKNVALDKVILHTYDPQATGLPTGVSDLRAAYKHFWSKDFLMRCRNVAADKYSIPTAVGYYPTSFSKKQQAALKRACMAVKNCSAIILPEGAKIELLEPKGSVVMPYDASIDNCNRGIAKAIFGQVLATDEGSQVGSYALGKIHKGILGLYLADIRKSISEQAFREQLFRRLVEYNYGKEYVDYVPHMVLPPPDDKEIDKFAQLIKVYLENGVVHCDEAFLRSELGFPPKPEDLKGLTPEIIPQEKEDKDVNVDNNKDGEDI